MNTKHASALMVIAACLWGSHPVLIQLIDWTPWGVAWIRSISCAVVLSIYIQFTGGISLKSWGIQSFCGLFLALNSLLFVSASTYTTPANAVVLMFIFPWVCLLLDFAFFKKRPIAGDLFRLGLGMCGILLMMGGDLTGDGAIGNVFALLAGVAIAVHIFLCQRLNSAGSGNQEVLTAMLLGWLLTIVVLAPSGFDGNFPQGDALKYLALFGLLSAIPWLLWGKAIPYIPGHVVAALLSVEAFVAALLGWLIIGVSPTLWTWCGGALTLIAASHQVFSTSTASASTDKN